MAYGIGSVIAQRFRLVGVIGRGGMAVVYEAEDLLEGGSFAVKMLEDEVRNDPEIVARFAREALATRDLSTAFVTRTHGRGRAENGTPFMVMDLLDGKDLGAVLRRRDRLPWAEAVAYVVQACAGIAAAHDIGLIHRDLKPANLFLSQTAEGVHVRVLDFGISKDRSASHELTNPRGLLGTTAYMSPEQVTNARDVDARSDVWALGVVLYRAITGTMPTRGTTAQVIGRIVDLDPLPRITQLDVPRALAKAIARALDKNPNGRPPDARAFAHALAPFAERTPAVAAALAEIDRSSPSVVVDDTIDEDPGPDPFAPTLPGPEVVIAPLAYVSDRVPDEWYAEAPVSPRVALFGAVVALLAVLVPLVAFIANV